MGIHCCVMLCRKKNQMANHGTLVEHGDNFDMEIIMMIKKFKYILAFATTLGSCYASASNTTYINGIDEDYGSPNTVRDDAILLSSGTGGFTGMTVPSGQTSSTTTTWNLGFDTAVGTTNATFALPTPVACTNTGTPPVNVHFLLSHAPATAPFAWFTGNLPTGARVIIEPQSADPGIGSILANLDSSNTLIIGAPIALPSSGNTTIACKVQRHPKIAAANAYNKAQLTVSANTTFSSAVNGISIAGSSAGGPNAFTLAFVATSDIIDPDVTNLGTITVNSTSLTAGTTLTVVGSHAALPTITATLDTTTSTTTTTKITTTTTPLTLAALSPVLNYVH